MGKRCWIIGIALLLAAPAALADKQDEAREHFMRGAVKYTEGNIDAALAEFQLAYALHPSYKIRYNIAQCHMEQERFGRAYEELYLYLYEGGGEVPPDRRAEVEQTISDLAARLGNDVPDPEQLKRESDAAQQPATAPPPPAPAPSAVPPPPQKWEPDPRAADLTLATRPADMPLRDWFGVGERTVSHFERVRRERPELTLDSYLVERGSESTGLFVVEILTAAAIGVGGGMALGGHLGENSDVKNGGFLLGGTAVIALAIELIVDVIDVGYPRVGYPVRLEAEIEAREEGKPGPSEPAAPEQPDSTDGPPSEASP